MASSCEWKVSTEEDGHNNAVLVKFSNGNVKNSKKLDFTLYRNVDESNPRKKNRRILTAESERLTYVGNNFGPGALQCNNLCRYFVGVLDKRTGQMEVHRAQLFNMHPVVQGETAADGGDANETKTYREKVDALIEAFGTNKQKRALSSRRLNEVGNDTLQRVVAQAADSVIKQKGIDALQQEVADTEAVMTLFLPPSNPDAETPEDVYPFDTLLSPVELTALEEAGRKMSSLSSEDLLKMREEGRPKTVLAHVECLPAEGAGRERQACCVFYLSQLINLAHQRKFRSKSFEEACPSIILNKLKRSFTVESFSSGRVDNVVSESMRVKLASHALALLLHMGDLRANITLLHRDLHISETRMLEVAKAMGLRLGKQPVSAGPESGIADEHKVAHLALPLMNYRARPLQRKRKRMT